VHVKVSGHDRAAQLTVHVGVFEIWLIPMGINSVKHGRTSADDSWTNLSSACFRRLTQMKTKHREWWDHTCPTRRTTKSLSTEGPSHTAVRGVADSTHGVP